MNLTLYNRSARSFVGKISQRIIEREIPITGWQTQRAEYRAPGEMTAQEEPRSIQTGTAWFEETMLFRAQADLSQLPAAQWWLLFENDGESLLYVNGEPVMGLDPGRKLYPLQGGGKLDLMVESAYRWQNFAHARQNGVEYPLQIFRRASLCTLRRSVQKCWNTLSCLLECINQNQSAWAIELMDYARLHIKPDVQDDGIFLAQVEELNGWLDARLAQAREAKKASLLYAAGHSHLDLAYLWPVKETVRKCGRTFANMLQLLDSYPDFAFTQSQPVLYEYAKAYYPELFERIAHYMRQGRWETVGGMYVEADGNMPSAESYIRQFLYGTEIMQREFGAETCIGWLPDTFGLTGILPQILKGCGIDYFYSAKLRSNEHYTFPYTNYHWEGIDGSRVLCTLDIHGTYNGAMTLEEIDKGQKRLAEDGLGGRDGLYVFGYGDGGGGVTREMLERAACYSSFPDAPLIQFGSAKDYFSALEEQAQSLPVWTGEKYYDVHQGTLTSRAILKKWNRRMENLMRLMELMIVVRGDAGKYRQLVDQPWKTLLFNQFHDILPGSHQGCVAQKAVEEFEAAESALMAYMQPAGSPGEATLWSGVSFPRDELLLLGEGIGGLRMNGKELPVQHLQDGRTAVVVRGIAGLSANSVELLAQTQNEMQGASLARTQGGNIVLENERVCAIIRGTDGELTSLLCKESGFEYISGGGNQLELYDECYEFYDAWNIHPQTVKNPLPLGGHCTVTIQENGPLVARVRVERQFSLSALVQHIVFYRDKARIDFETEIHWHETSRMLRVAFNSTVFSTKAVFDLSCGNLERSTRNNLLYEQVQIETCGHKWADLSDGRQGLALMNDCKYGYSVKGSTLRLTLLKSPNYPDPDCDRGTHRFVYSIYPHVGDFRKGEVDREACCLNMPVFLSAGGSSSLSVVKVDDPAVLVEAVKYAHDGTGDVIVRLYENHGGACNALVDLGKLAYTAVHRCDMLERPQQAVDVQGGAVRVSLTPYQIVTLRLCK